LVKEVWIRGFTSEELDHFEFHPLAIEFKGIKEDLISSYEFEISFGPTDMHNKHRDLGHKSWNAQFIDDQLVGINREI
jgi:hypothetical protein